MKGAIQIKLFIIIIIIIIIMSFDCVLWIKGMNAKE